LLNSFAIFFGLTFAFLIQPITFAPTDCPSHRSLIPIQHFKNENFKLKFYGLPTLFHLFSYIKREMKERQREKEERKKREER
jgi:hypothetical protein